MMKKNENVIIYLTNKVLVSLHTAWQLGFTEAEGCFTISFLSNYVAFRTRYIISQKGAEHLPVFSRKILLFGVGVAEKHSQVDNFQYCASGLKNVSAIYNYFDCYIDAFMGTKLQSYLKFKELNIRILNKEHLDPLMRESMIQEAQKFNLPS